jgi:polysaccharide export outer membrane protein
VNRHHLLSALLAAALLTTSAACRTAPPKGAFVWVQDFQEPAQADNAYIIAPGDLINVRVFSQDGMSGRSRVRNDGMISLPFINEIRAADSSPLALAARIRDRLKEFVVNPVVTVSLEEPRPSEVSVVGEVVHPGVYKLEPRGGVLSALASAGGLNDFADRSRIFVLRDRQRIRFTFQALSEAEPKAIGFKLVSGDVVVAE